MPEAQRILVHRTGSHNQYRRVLKFASDLSSYLHRIQSLKVAAGLLIVLVLLGSLDLVTRATVRKSPELAQGTIFEPVPVSGAQLEAVPLPTQKPPAAYKISKKKQRNQPLKKEWLSEKARSAERHHQGTASTNWGSSTPICFVPDCSDQPQGTDTLKCVTLDASHNSNFRTLLCVSLRALLQYCSVLPQ